MAVDRTEANPHLMWDDFRQGFSVGSPSAQWFYFSAGSYVGDDGIATTSPSGLRVVAGGTHPRTGEPAFRRTLAPEAHSGGVPGSLDHVKWLVYFNHRSARGYPGFDIGPGQTLTCEAWLSARTFGTAAHPFGTAVADPHDDVRLACCAMNTLDFETGLVCNFFLTNTRIYALYERLPFARDTLGPYAAFTCLIPVAERCPDDVHHLTVVYEKAAGTVRWSMDEREVYRVDKLGYLVDRQYLMLDHGGEEVEVSPQQLAAGMGMFTLLDGCRANQGLVRLSLHLEYWSPESGAPTRVKFVDEDSLASNRLFGQGAQLEVHHYVVSRRP